MELITPARFLFNAGATPRSWNEKMLNDEYLKVLFYEQEATKIFPNTIITGGIAVTYANSTKKSGAIEVLQTLKKLNAIIKKWKVKMKLLLVQFLWSKCLSILTNLS